MPIGEASISFTCRIPGAWRSAHGSGSLFPRMKASRPGIRLSSIRVVLPDPETPVTAVSLPFGISVSSDFTVWMGPVER